ncbi:aromatic ring-hydroxylating oxygenase subunit alpha [Nitrospirillum viridazoti]|uniref:(2Fe-2S)-binding protein n=1 Tax=Nitrospirillum viridazoti CBAmc TaxID=1441467 RepID=A0A248JVJ9_9PROT|nr:aromatic ring-hydroxylating dioxygenase subunit alpha [Nitrospirillum amazonense]ASG22244.1 (2Fe-2S)-binding protein [Nitrospirillum amazonense CBAmc]TWB30990.1 Rieske-like 2Fe-2S protein [Nitrospirillum amazonense]
MTDRIDAPKLETDRPEVRPDFVPAASYIAPEYVRLEKERLWPRVWQMACREEEIAQPGDYYTYDIADESITVVRQKSGAIAAYFNVCPHRGRRLTAGCGHTARLHCKYHGWKWTLDGKPADIVDRQDWGDCLQDADVTLEAVKVGTWGGWVFINMDPECEPLEEFLEPAKAILDPYQFDKMRYVWRKSIVMPCNWKVALEAFNEGYHVQTTHRQLLAYLDDMTYSAAKGKHGMFGYAPNRLYGLPSPRLGEAKGDMRRGLYLFNKEIWDTLQATTTKEMLAAAARLVELPEDADPYTIYGAFAQFHREEAAKNNRPFPDVPVETLIAAGTDWHIFPNLVFLQQPTNVLFYRARPNGDDPDSCIFEINVIERFAEGANPDVAVEHGADWAKVDWGLILEQDFQNMGEVQKGMKSRGFKGARPSPVQERAISNFHETLHHYLWDKN